MTADQARKLSENSKILLILYRIKVAAENGRYHIEFCDRDFKEKSLLLQGLGYNVEQIDNYDRTTSVAYRISW